MYCPNCGAQNEEDARFCRACGAGLAPGAGPGPSAPAARDDGRVGLLGVVFFCIPIVGAVMYFVWKDEKPASAKKACTLALVGFGLGIVLQFLAAIVQMAAAAG